jgi:predicted metal-dependent peptidase
VVSVADLDAPTIDERWRLYLDPVAANGYEVQELGALLVHHCGHILRDHANRARAIGITPDRAPDWVMAADAEINDDLEEIRNGLPTTAVVPADLNCPEGLMAEQYFTMIDEPIWQEAPCGSGADGQKRDYELDPDEHSGLSAHESEHLRHLVASAILAETEPGSVPAGLRRWAESLLRPQLAWPQVLGSAIRRSVAQVVGAVDYSYRRPSRRSVVSPKVVLPSLRRPVPEVAVICDTSASMSNDLLATVLGEVRGILGTVGLHGTGVRVLSCDSKVGCVQRVYRPEQVTLMGGGGTDMGVGLAAAAALRPRPQIAIVLTDGLTPWPAKAPAAMSVVVALIGRRGRPAPDWARTVRVDSAVPS